MYTYIICMYIFGGVLTLRLYRGADKSLARPTYPMYFV